MRREFKIHCTSPDVKPDHLIRLFHFGRTETELANVLHVDVAIVRCWKYGTTAVPVLCVKHLELLNADNVIRHPGVWHGARVEGSRLVIPYGTDLTFDYAQAERLSQYRRRYHLHALQTDLVEKLMMERDSEQLGVFASFVISQPLRFAFPQGKLSAACCNWVRLLLRPVPVC